MTILTPPIKPYRSIPIRECGEALIAIPAGMFALTEPHPYIALGADYGGVSPWMLRQSIVESLQKAQAALQQRHPGWRIKLHDAYRPNEVQQFMVNREYGLVAQAASMDPDHLTEAQREALSERVYRVWAIPSDDPATPPPHSTGAAVDCTLVDANGIEIDMGSPLDENSDRSNPDYFADSRDAVGQRAHANRMLLFIILAAEGFHRNPIEWWHFSRGDQMAVYAERNDPSPPEVAIYGRADLRADIIVGS